MPPTATVFQVIVWESTGSWVVQNISRGLRVLRRSAGVRYGGRCSSSVKSVSYVFSCTFKDHRGYFILLGVSAPWSWNLDGLKVEVGWTLNHPRLKPMLSFTFALFPKTEAVFETLTKIQLSFCSQILSQHYWAAVCCVDRVCHWGWSISALKHRTCK